MDQQLAISLNINAGPLAQVSFGSISLPSIRTAVQLATGAYGWFKGVERSQSLVQLLESYDAQLTPTSAFSLPRYQEARARHDNIVGIFLEDGITTAVKLPNGSSAITNLHGMTCLRAVACCLLCLCDESATVAILQKLLPHTLISASARSADDRPVEIEGPLLTGLKQWVHTTALEEQSNKFRDHLLGSAEKELRQLEVGDSRDAINEIRRTSLALNSGDDALILGVLRWTLTPAHVRDIRRYPTRSLRVWMAASIMSQLGFTVSAANWTVKDREGFKKAMDHSTGDSNTFDVFLVSTHRIDDRTCDALAELVNVPDEIPLPRAMFLQDIPAAVFKHVDVAPPRLWSDDPDNIAYLAYQYKVAFETASRSFKSITVDNFHVKIELKESSRNTVSSDFAKRVFTPFSPHIHKLCVPILDELVGCATVSQEASWDFSDSDTLFENIRHPSWSPTERNFYTAMTIVLGAIYGTCSRACYENGSPLTGYTEIAFNPDNIYEDKCRLLKRWVKSLGHALQGTVTYLDWQSTLFEMFLGSIDKTDPERAVVRPGDTSGRKGYIFGIQSHGFVAVSDILFQLQMQPSSLGIFHIARGQILNLPMDDQGFIRGSDYLPNAIPLALGNAEQSDVDCLYRSTEAFPVDSTRFDLEPCWEDDPRTIILAMRQAGLMKASLNIGRVLERRSRCVVACNCGKNSNEAKVPVKDQWYRLLIEDLTHYNVGGMRPGRLASLVRDSSRRNFLIDASRCEEALVYVLGIIDVQGVIIAKECLECAYEHYKSRDWNHGVAIVIPHDNDLIEDTEEEQVERKKKIEDRLRAAEKRKMRFRRGLRSGAESNS